MVWLVLKGTCHFVSLCVCPCLYMGHIMTGSPCRSSMAPSKKQLPV